MCCCEAAKEQNDDAGEVAGTNPKAKFRFFFSLARCIKRASYLLKEFIILKGIHEG